MCDGNVTECSNRGGMKGAATLLVIVLATVIILLGNPSQTVSAFLQRACELTHWSDSCEVAPQTGSASTSTSTSTSTSLK